MNHRAAVAIAQFVVARADDELWELALAAPDPTTNPARVRRLRRQAITRRDMADHYLRLHESNATAAKRAHELQRVLCLMAHLDDDHPDFPAATRQCQLDCRAPLW